MKILLTEEARDMLIPLIVRSSKGEEGIIKIRPAELLNSIESLDKLNDVITLRRGLWRGAAIGAGLTAAYYIYKNRKLKDRVEFLEAEVDEYAIKEAIYESEEA